MPQGEQPVPDEAVRSAIARSHFRHLPEATVAGLFAGARRIHVPAGSAVRSMGEAGPHLEFVVSGFVRIFVTAADGRTLTVRYFQSGGLAGVASLFTPQFSMPGSIQALRESDLLSLRPESVQTLAASDLAVARGLLDELSERVVSFVAEIPGSVFATVRQRVARHLLDLASEQQRGQDLVAHVSQQGLADAVGSVREVVVRVLRDLREERIIATGRSGITILQPDDLMLELFPATEPAPRG